MRVFAAWALLGFGCGETVLLIDPPVVFDGPDAGMISGDPSIELGKFSEQFFTPLSASGRLPIVAGFQGGTWVMPAIRAVALGSNVVARGEVVLVASGEKVGQIEDPQARLQPTAAGYSELVALPIPIAHAPPRQREPIDDLYGVQARLTVRITDGTRTAESTIMILLVQG